MAYHGMAWPPLPQVRVFPKTFTSWNFDRAGRKLTINRTSTHGSKTILQSFRLFCSGNVDG